MSSIEPTKVELFNRACARHPVTGFADHRSFLGAIYGWIKDALPSYSYVAFADDLGFSRTNVLFLIITRRRPLTLKAARRISDGMGLDGLDRRYFETLVRRAAARPGEERDALSQALADMARLSRPETAQETQLELFSAWYHPVILGMMALPSFRSDPGWIAAHIRPAVTPAQASASLALLERLGLAKVDPDRGRHVPALAELAAGADVVPDGRTNAPFHRQVMELGLNVLAAGTQGGASDHEFSSVIVGVSPATEERLRCEIRRFRQALVEVARESPEAERVMQINLQLFPVSSRGP